jgi:hypothetical protein
MSDGTEGEEQTLRPRRRAFDVTGDPLQLNQPSRSYRGKMMGGLRILVADCYENGPDDQGEAECTDWSVV